MDYPSFDKDGYPTEETLKFIREFIFNKNISQFIEFIISAWHWGENYANWKPPILELHTGGWSGNEEIISALQESKSLFWVLYWQKSERGGHYYFKIPI